MPKKNDKINTDEENTLQLVSENEVKEMVGNAYASLLLNPLVSWAKFVLTDDLPNGNGQRIPLEEFDNLITSGLHMPLKMAEGKIEEDHSNARPIGVITHLKREFIDGINQIIGLAALWLRERPSDVSYLKGILDDGGDINLSWEIAYGDSRPGEGGTVDLRDVVLQAATIVTNPAYLGRTRIVAMAAKKKATKEEQTTQVQAWDEDYVNSLPDSSFLYIERGGEKDSQGRTSPHLRHFPVKDDKGALVKDRLEKVLQEAGQSNLPTPVLKTVKKTVSTLLERAEAGASLQELGEQTAPLENFDTEDDNVEELEQLKQQVKQLTDQLEAAQAKLAEKEQAVAALETEKQALTTEVEGLKTFKNEAEAAKAKEEKTAAIKAKFSEAGLQKDEKYFEENMEKLLGMDDAALDFMVQELKAFSQTAEASHRRVPNLISSGGELTIKDLAKGLRERNKKAK